MSKNPFYDVCTKNEVIIDSYNRVEKITRKIDKLEKFVMESKEFEKFAFASIIFFYCYIGLHVGFWIVRTFI